MSTHTTLCLRPDWPCDLNGPREHMCETCLTYVVRKARPNGWSPRTGKMGPSMRDRLDPSDLGPSSAWPSAKEQK